MDTLADLDTARDLLQAKACANGNTELCASTPAISIGGFAHGALWIRFLALCYRLGLSIGAIQKITLFFVALGAGVTAVATQRYAGYRGAWMAGAIFVPWALWIIQEHIFWNPTLLPLPLSLFVWALLAHADEGRTRTAVIAAFSLALSIDLHLVCVALAPLLIATTVASARRPLLTNGLVFATVGLTLRLDSAGTWAHNHAVLEASNKAWLLALSIPATTAAGLIARASWSRLEPRHRAALLVVLMVAWLGVPVITGITADRYFAPTLPALALAGGWLFQLLTTRPRTSLRWASAGLFVLVVANTLHGRRTPEGLWTLADISRVLPTVESYGLGGGASFLRLEGLGYESRASFAALGTPRQNQSVDSLMVLRTSRSSLPRHIPEHWTVVPLKRNQVAVLRPLRPYLQRERLEACFRPLLPNAKADCVQATYEPQPTELDYPPFRGLWAVFGDDRVAASPEAYRAELYLDIDTGQAGSEHVIDLIDSDDDWQIASVQGVAHEGQLPARRVVLKGGTGRGRLGLLQQLEAGTRPSPHWPPRLVETLPEEVELRRLLAEQGLTIAPTGRRTASVSPSLLPLPASSD